MGERPLQRPIVSWGQTVASDRICRVDIVWVWSLLRGEEGREERERQRDRGGERGRRERKVGREAGLPQWEDRDQE